MGQQLVSTILAFSPQGLPVEVTDGLRVLSAPVGSLKFCQSFLLKALSQAQSETCKPPFASIACVPPTKSPIYCTWRLQQCSGGIVRSTLAME
jgi:hypothetical protein